MNVLSTMGDGVPLSIPSIVRRGIAVHADSHVTTWTGEEYRQASFAEVVTRAERLVAALQAIGVRPGDRVATFAWNTQEHQEAYLAVPGMGAVLHTVNVRLFPEQVAWIINHAADSVVIVDSSLLPVLAPIASQLTTVRTFLVIGDGDLAQLPGALAYEDVLAQHAPGWDWPDRNEREPAAMCYTSGTTGDPKGVVYSQRSMWLHSLAVTSGAALGLTENDRVLPAVPMFHANAWGLPYACWMVGADLLLPGRFVQAPHLARIISEQRATIAAGVPTLWSDLLVLSEQARVDYSSIRLLMSGGSAAPPGLIAAFEERHGVRLVQGWGMTETSPFATLAHPPKISNGSLDWRQTAGRPVPGVELRVAPRTGSDPASDESVGEIQVRGPWVTTRYHGVDAVHSFEDGWLRTGDLGSIDDRAFLRITDREKDVIKSGGEWISSLDLENALREHPGVAAAAVIATPDDRWSERPLACVVRVAGSDLSATALAEHLEPRVARWWIPEHWSFVDAIPLTGVGKSDKARLRKQHAAGALRVESTRADAVDPAAPSPGSAGDSTAAT